MLFFNGGSMQRGKRSIQLDKNKNSIINMYNNGLTQQDIADKFGVHQGTIGRRLIKWGITSGRNLDNDIIKEMYVKDCYTCREIAERFRVSVSCINNRLHTMSIYRKCINRDFVRTALRVDISKNVLKDLYFNKKLTMNNIAEKFNCSRSSIYRRMMEYGLRPRNKVEAANRGINHHNYNKHMSKKSKDKLIK